MARKITKQITGGFVDESIEPRALEALNVDDETRERIAALIGDYRLSRDYRDTAPTPAAAITHLKQTQTQISNLLAKFEVMPEDFKALATDYYMKIAGEVYEDAEQRISLDLLRFKSVCTGVIEKMQQWPSMKGETPKYLEHKLLAGVAELLEPYSIGVEQAAGNAAQFLRAAGVPWMPVDRKQARADVLAYLKKQ